MAVPARNFDRLRLPARSRANRFTHNDEGLTTVLAERVAAMPDGGAGICSVGGDTISVWGLDPVSRHQVLSRGWGKLGRQEVLLFLPRDEEELEICWSILSYAYLTAAHADSRPPFARMSPWSSDLPRFSRTTLQ